MVRFFASDMKTFHSTIFIFFTFLGVFAQDTSDAERLGRLDYMKLARTIDCDNQSGTNLDYRICLNLKFQKLDSLMNKKFKILLDRIDSDSIKNLLKEYQLTWVKNRRLQSQIMSKGYKGHMFGITYLKCMVESTRSRDKELEQILGLY